MIKYNAHDRHQMAAMRAGGSPWAEVGSAFGVSDQAARQACRRIDETNNWEARIQDMKPLDAVEYLSNILRFALPHLSHEEHEVDGWGARLTEMHRRLIIILVDAQGRIVSKESIFSLMYADRMDCDVPDPKIVDAYVCKLRKIIPPEIGTIETIWGFGYRFERAEG